MANKNRKRCLICGRAFEMEAVIETSLEESLFADAPPKTTSICPLCEAKIKKEAERSQKEFKPM